MNAGPERHLLFSTPVLVDRLPETAEINPRLERAILDRREQGPGIKRTNRGGWHSDLDLLRWAGEFVRPAIARMVALADAATVDTQARSGERRGWLLEAWANVNPPGASNVPHSHGGTYWSAVYYVRVDPGTGGELVLHDPRMPALDMHAPALRFRDAGGEQVVRLKPEAGMIVLFPAWLLHSVAPWEGEGLRISIAVNMSAQPRPQPISPRPAQ
jgi:uncharacterized protein (TIGR02466 family)